MFSKHFLKTLFIFLMIIASGVLLILAVDYSEKGGEAASVEQS